MARKRVQDAERAMMQEQKHMMNVGKARASTTRPGLTFKVMLNDIEDSLRDLACSDDEEHGEDEDDGEEDKELAKLSEDDEPGWVMGTLSKNCLAPHSELRQKPMKLDTVIHPE